jgi:glycosyltransferase involved in cell wall biosynthesis
MPVYNEAATVEAVVAAWSSMLDSLAIDYELLVHDDGSQDGTGALLDELSARLPRLHVTHGPNRGHGPSVLSGYLKARGRWVFQTDSDDEIPAAAFTALWTRRDAGEFVFGVRTARQSNSGRRVLSRGASLAVRTLFGGGPADVNVPFRLMRADALGAMLPRVPANAFAPNVILSGLCVRDRRRWIEVPVPSRPRQAGVTSLSGAKMLRAAGRAVREACGVALRERARVRS